LQPRRRAACANQTDAGLPKRVAAEHLRRVLQHDVGGCEGFDPATDAFGDDQRGGAGHARDRDVEGAGVGLRRRTREDLAREPTALQLLHEAHRMVRDAAGARMVIGGDERETPGRHGTAVHDNKQSQPVPPAARLDRRAAPGAC
jgi:hypothetical protein